ncbi:MAG: Nif3-like dinuclear metal center hexameric protein [Lachnospiraceae bacterium]|nr:Nif3-like dinuclear metal center hexameric protein [Lachnospiraceae bacterium]
MKCQGIIEAIEERYPVIYACEWDNVGLLVGERDREVKRVFVALDATDAAIEEAIKGKADLLLTHHPMIFGSIKSVTTDDYTGERIIRLIRNEISYYAMHTNYDTMGMAELSAKRLNLADTFVLEEVFDGEGIGRVGSLPDSMTLRQCAELVKECFHLPNVKVFGELDKTVKIAAISPGAGKSMARPALLSGADVLITGDIDHHTGIDMADCGLAIIDAGHYGIEHIFIDDIKNFLAKHFPELEVITAQIHQPFEVL